MKCNAHFVFLAKMCGFGVLCSVALWGEAGTDHVQGVRGCEVIFPGLFPDCGRYADQY